MDIERYLVRWRREIERALQQCIGPARRADRLDQAMRYSLLGGGKRLRPLLAIAATEALGGNPTVVMPFACAIEMIHTYSLIHDDLPAMDDDGLRRGKPTNHIVFGEALAILAGDALLTDAFRVMATAAAAARLPQRHLQVLTEVATAAGARGMVAGQAADMQAENESPSLAVVEFIHVRKTGELIRASVRTGAVLAGARPVQLRHLTRYADCVGLAFQVADDILDSEAASGVTGKSPGRDATRHKATFPAVLGLPAAKQRARELLVTALEALRPFDEGAEPLREIAKLIVDRASPA